jgi:hypothetical protein
MKTEKKKHQRVEEILAENLGDVQYGRHFVSFNNPNAEYLQEAGLLERDSVVLGNPWNFRFPSHQYIYYPFTKKGEEVYKKYKEKKKA